MQRPAADDETTTSRGENGEIDDVDEHLLAHHQIDLLDELFAEAAHDELAGESKSDEGRHGTDEPVANPDENKDHFHSEDTSVSEHDDLSIGRTTVQVHGDLLLDPYDDHDNAGDNVIQRALVVDQVESPFPNLQSSPDGETVQLRDAIAYIRERFRDLEEEDPKRDRETIAERVDTSEDMRRPRPWRIKNLSDKDLVELASEQSVRILLPDYHTSLESRGCEFTKSKRRQRPSGIGPYKKRKKVEEKQRNESKVTMFTGAYFVEVRMTLKFLDAPFQSHFTVLHRCQGCKGPAKPDKDEDHDDGSTGVGRGITA